jgi:hypothetical protein
MPMQRCRHVRDLAPAERLKRAIRTIDKHLEQIRRSNQPIPMNAYRARRILLNALARCERPGADARPALFTSDTVRADAEFRPRRSYRGPVERYEALPGLHLPLPEPQDFTGCAAHAPATNSSACESDSNLDAYERTHMAYDWTGEATRRKSRLKLALAVLLSLAVVVGMPAVVVPFL